MTTPTGIKRRQRADGMFTRSRGKLVVVSAATIACLYLCYRLAQPFMPALVWAVTGAVITHPLVGWIGRWIESPRWRAAAAVAIVIVVLFTPAIGLVYFAAIQVGQSLENVDPNQVLAQWQEAIDDSPRLSTAWQRISQHFNVATTAEQLTERAREFVTTFVAGSMYSLLQALVAVFVLYFLYRDEGYILANVKRLSPLTENETNRLLKRLADTVHATIFGTVVVAIVQGTLGGLIFWWLGLPAPVLWGTVMALLAMIPYLGAFFVWAPAAVFLIANGDWGKGLVLVAWGTVVVGLIDNLIYPMLVGSRLRQHTVITFVAIVGGIALFGASGIVLGPVIASLTFFLLEVWRQRTSDGRAAEQMG
ncbi:MAG TPA: AI-2E family transporter [Lacipirellulaceae bacterium]|nr:AI-2E family transporter [Lacipirellulaceae bacterium]